MDRRVIDRGVNRQGLATGREARKMNGERTLPSGLVLARKPTESVDITVPPGFSGVIRVFVTEVRGTTARLLFNADDQVKFLRGELAPTG